MKPSVLEIRKVEAEEANAVSLQGIIARLDAIEANLLLLVEKMDAAPQKAVTFESPPTLVDAGLTHKTQAKK